MQNNITQKYKDAKRLILNEHQLLDLKNIAKEVYAPLTGFLRKEDFISVAINMRLKNGKVWPIPIVLDINAKEYNDIKNKKQILVSNKKNVVIALIKNIEIFANDKNFFAKNVFGTTNKNHPGVEEIYKMGNYLIGGDVELLNDDKHPFQEYNFSPEKIKKIFKKRGWKTIVAFQTRNVPHQGHEFLQKQALKKLDGLFIHPVIGPKKMQDFKDEYILASYEILLNRYFPKNKAILGILPLKMRYAGPREAVFHALIRKNFGCTHFIVGRDHAGIANYYPPFAAQEIFDQFQLEEIGIKILKYPEVVYCENCKDHTFINTCSHSQEKKLSFSGSDLRKHIQNKTQPPAYIIRPEIYNILSQAPYSLVDRLYKNPVSKKQKGFVLWFTGLSRAGKTTNADEVYKLLKQKGLKVERLDGDIIREYLSQDLGFSKKDRYENIRRVKLMAKLLSKNGIGVIASFISPYHAQREEIRKEVENFIEVFCNCPLEKCEARDTKGLYKKARRKEIENFTGISDPYEKPKNPEIELFTDNDSSEMNAQKVISYIEKKGVV